MIVNLGICYNNLIPVLKNGTLYVLFIFCILSCQSFAQLPSDRTENRTIQNVRSLGNIPLQEGMTGRDRNIWDMAIYNNRLFIGYGNTTTNPGLIPLYSYDLNKEEWRFEENITSHAIEKIRIIDSTMYIPASDPVRGDRIKFWTLQDTIWTMHEFLPNLAHVRDIIPYRKHLYLLGNTRCPSEKKSTCSGVIRINSETGKVESGFLEDLLNQADSLYNPYWNWFFGAWIIHDKLILPNAMFSFRDKENLIIKNNSFFVFDEDEVTWSAFPKSGQVVSDPNFFPNNSDNSDIPISLRPYESIEYDGRLFYNLKTYSMSDSFYYQAYNNSVGIFTKSSLYDEAKVINFENKKTIGEDLLIDEGILYALANEKLENNSFLISIFKHTSRDEDSEKWTKVSSISSSNLGRSFAKYNNVFYIGLGANHEDTIGRAGEVIAVRVD